MKILHLISFAILGTSCVAQAADLKLSNLAGSQSSFKILSENLGAATSYKGVIPAEPLGITGFDIGAEITSTKITDKTVWARATGSNSPDYLTQTKLHAHKGLPFGFDVGFVASNSTNSNISTVGGELRYALVSGNVVMPAIGLRAAYTKVNGIDQLGLDNKSVELTISKGFLMFKPYAGIGHVWTSSRPDAGLGLAKEDIGQFRSYVGTNVNLGLINFALEADKIGAATSLSAKVGLRF
ncbi:MAG: hypothetical protein LW629_07980 [Burkholderiales bacterium]|jgi:hypothetical protein|nr:hypothetical protein [Burkholderiales bacterium]